ESQNLWKRSLRVELLADRLHLITQALVFFELVGDLLDRVKGGRVIAPAKSLSDRGQGGRRLFANQVHRDLAGKDDVLVAALAFHVVEGHVVVVGDQDLDPLHVDGLARTGGGDVGQ